MNKTDTPTTPSVKHRLNRAPVNTPQKCGWRVNEWFPAVGCSRSYACELIRQKKIASVKADGMRIITTPPAAFLASLAEAD